MQNPTENSESPEPPAPPPAAGRQYVRFAFYKLDPLWRRLDPDQRSDQKRALVAAISSIQRRMIVRPYSLIGTRADAEFLLWQIAESPDAFQDVATTIASTRMGSYLNLVQSFFSQTKRSVYDIGVREHEADDQLVVEPSEARYLFVYPFVKTRNWYRLPHDERQKLMNEHIRVGRKYPGVRLNTTYCFGLDDYEFIVAFETDDPSDFLDLVQELRETETSSFTLSDTPLYTATGMGLAEALDTLAGPPIAHEFQSRSEGDEWIEVCPVGDLGPGRRRVVVANNRQVVVVNAAGHYYGISNRCSHARGPLGEGDLNLDGDRCTLTCPWHHAIFDLANGEVIDGIASAPVETYPVEIRDGLIHVASRPASRALVGAAR